MKWSAILNEYLQEHTLEDSTIDKTQVCLNHYAKAGKQGFQNYLLGKGLRAATVNSYVKTLKPLFRWAEEKGYLTNPFVGLRPLKAARKPINVYAADEITALLSSANLMWRARLLAAYQCGLRKGEVLNLTVEDVDFEKMLLFVKPKSETAKTWRWQPKDKDYRTLPLTKELADILTKILLELPEGQTYLMIKPERYKYLMELRKNKLKNRLKKSPENNFRREFLAIAKRAGVKGTFHDLRRSFVTTLLKNGLPAHEVKVLAGHSDIQTTINYYAAFDTSSIDMARLVFNRGDRI